MKVIYFFLFLFSCAFGWSNAWIVKEEFLSPDVEHFDCHTSSIVETEPGHLYAIWKGGAGEGECNCTIKQGVGIWASSFDGKSWSMPKEIVMLPDSVCWNPVLCKLPSNELLLFYRVGPDPRRMVALMKRSNDLGQSWSEAEILPAGIIGPKRQPLINADGTLICPSSVEVGEPDDLFKATACWIEISTDRGIHWSKVGPFELPGRKFGGIEPVLFFDTNGDMRMLCRDRAHRIGEKGYIWEAISRDGGLHWSEFEQTDLPNPDAGIDVVDLGDGKRLLIYNHSHTERSPLNIALSVDGGEHWSEPYLLADTGEFPAATVTSDGMVHVTYSMRPSDSEQRRIMHVVIDCKKL